MGSDATSVTHDRRTSISTDPEVYIMVQHIRHGLSSLSHPWRITPLLID